MIKNNKISDLASSIRSDKSFDDLNILEDPLFPKFKESLFHNLEKGQKNEVNLKNKFTIAKKKKKTVKKKEVINSKEKIIKKSKNQIKNFENKKKICNKIASNSSYDSKRPFLGNINNNISDINSKNKEHDFLGKKRNLFKIDSHKDFSIFNYRDYNMYIRKIIQQVLENSNQISSLTNAESEKVRKPKIKIQNVQARKENADNIRKKIKSRFLKYLRNTVNEKLKLAGSKKFFKFLPQIFTSDISREKNKVVLNLSFKEIFSKNFCEGKKIKENDSDLLNYYHNISVLEYLEQNDKISEKSNFNNFKNMKFYQIFNEYLKSREFEMEIASLKKAKENDKYIRNYIIKASDLMDFFAN